MEVVRDHTPTAEHKLNDFPLPPLINELLWQQHEAYQKVLEPIRKFYDLHGETIQDLDKARQEIVKRYFQMNEDGTLKENKQNAYMLIKGKEIASYDNEMLELMTKPVKNAIPKLGEDQ